MTRNPYNKSRGFIVYRGPSLLDGAPIVAIVLPGKSSNAKTGAMAQSYILRADIAPIDAVRRGADVSICGDCPHRGSAIADAVLLAHGATKQRAKANATRGLPASRSCYVNIGQGPRGVFGAFTRGAYADATDPSSTAAAALRDRLLGRPLRLGTYGDPGAVPHTVWSELVRVASAHTGYTHAWTHPALSREQRAGITALCMASVDTPEAAALARAGRLRYFRVRTADEPIGPREFICPASAEGGTRVQCARCTACDGSARGPKASPVIIAHGSLARRFNALRTAVRA